MPGLTWDPIITRAAEIVRGYDIPVTLRQLFYRLVSEEGIPNAIGPYKRLSSLTAELRRTDDFPRLFDRGRRIARPAHWDGPAAAMDALIEQYRIDRTADQDVQLWLGVEKNALAGLLEDWFDDYGLPVIPLGGYSSESIDRVVRDEVLADGRPAVLIYAGDFDASGMHIGRSFVRFTDCWKEVRRLGLSEAQVFDLDLPVLPGKPKDSRAPGFIQEFPMIHTVHDFGSESGKRIPVQVEVDAVDPYLFHDWFTDAIAEFLDEARFEAAKASEAADIDRLRDAAATLPD